MKTYQNKISIVLVSCLAILFSAGCSDSFLTKYPLDQLTEETAFVTYDNFKTYAWGFYVRLPGYSTGEGTYTPYHNGSYINLHNEIECHTDNFSKSQPGQMSEYKYQTKTEPATNTTKYTQPYQAIRRVNVMLDNIDDSGMTQGEKDHWRSVGLFFRSFEYFSLLADYGDIIWVEHVIGDSDTDVYLGSRTPRDEVANNILQDLLWAEANIKEDGDGNNTINVHAVRALISRFGLFEGTWRKYHGLTGSETYLNASVNASTKLLSAFPGLVNSYDDIYNSVDLQVGPATGIILARKYSSTVSGAGHSMGRLVRTEAWYYDVTKDAIESYLCTDGKPIGTSTVYEGDENIYTEFRNRDRRLYYTVMPPYRIKFTGAVGTSYDDEWEYTEVPEEYEYIEMMKTITPETGKYLPIRSFWAGVTGSSPHFRYYPEGHNYCLTHLGYYYWKYYYRHEDDLALRSSVTNYPVFRMGEILVNHAEVMFELGRFNQSVADQTINKLRDRVEMPHMNISQITSDFDPARDQTVDPVLWEIRRERRIELLGDGFRFNDLKRWKKGDYINKWDIGVRVKNSDYDNKLTIVGDAPEGNVYFFPEPQGWLDKYYLEPIPIREQTLNPNLTQNPGWTDYRGTSIE